VGEQQLVFVKQRLERGRDRGVGAVVAVQQRVEP
jgi:hypothetical protein